MLSPLTPYLGLCDNHAAVTVRVPYDHNEALHHLRSLAYKLGGENREFTVDLVARALGEMLGTVPGLTAELNRNRDSSRAGEEDLQFSGTHLRMILSASELALLPFEMSLSPSGFPGMGSPLLLQEQSPICLTREVRRTHRTPVVWPGKPKVLFICASPGDVGAVPMDDHLRTLRSLLEPWANYAEQGDRRLSDQLVVLPNASCAEIEQACAENDFSHVHILAHGIEYADGYDVRFGLALHNPMDPNGPADRVSGDRLATALRPVSRAGARKLARPLSVTIASCDSGNQGTVGGLGGSVAFALHQVEIPLVIASQFPLSVAASSVFVRVLYESLLWGLDPRVALYDLRRKLSMMFPSTHDWASVTAYASLPDGFDEWLVAAELKQTYSSMEAAMKYADFVTEKVKKADLTAVLPGDQNLLDDSSQKVEHARERMERLFLKRSVADRSELAGKLAATEKRCAQIYYYFSRVESEQSARFTKIWQRLLQKSRTHYWNVFELNRDNGWAVVQFLSLDLILRSPGDEASGLALEPYEAHNQPGVLWQLAHDLSLNDLRDREDQLRRWALGNLIELYLIALIMKPQPNKLKPSKAVETAIKYAKDLVDSAGPDSFEVYSTRRQILRYLDWYSKIARLGDIDAGVNEILKALPVAKPA